jgi:hypothetical protein
MPGVAGSIEVGFGIPAREERVAANVGVDQLVQIEWSKICACQALAVRKLQPWLQHSSVAEQLLPPWRWLQFDVGHRRHVPFLCQHREEAAPPPRREYRDFRRGEH